jgi:hypothetical protein
LQVGGAHSLPLFPGARADFIPLIIVGLPGERAKLCQGRVSVNGKIINDPQGSQVNADSGFIAGISEFSSANRSPKDLGGIRHLVVPLFYARHSPDCLKIKKLPA